ncbi:hypothetical protein GF362_01255 [Candidatus Dojkabacteria bacterium]|nr:hypothetical protein [Candidatus Dojkabacteria bacterium]
MRKRKRRTKIIYRCKNCQKHFSIDYNPQIISDKEILVRHLEGTSIRKLASQLTCSKSKIQRIISSTLLKVPNSNHLTEFTCKYFKNGILLVDGKYIHVKGYKEKIPLIWCMDYYSHDILAHILAPSENYWAYLALFRQLNKCEYPLQVLVCDGHKAIVPALRRVYRNFKIQLCTNHFKEDVRKTLNVRSNDKHKKFMAQLENIFQAKNRKDFQERAIELLKRVAKNEIYQSILSDMDLKYKILTTHYDYKFCPRSTNLIELFNSHLEARVRSTKGFESWESAQLWLNAYVINRRLSKFTDCCKKFKYLNGKCSLYYTAEIDPIDIPLIKEIS